MKKQEEHVSFLKGVVGERARHGLGVFSGAAAQLARGRTCAKLL